MLIYGYDCECERKVSLTFLMKFTDEPQRCISPYAIIGKIRGVAGHNSMSVSGNNRASVAVEMEIGRFENNGSDYGRRRTTM